MNSLLFDFKVDESTNSVFITREFDAELSFVWDHLPNKILDQWWAPNRWFQKPK
jgi:hypothetical protein